MAEVDYAGTPNVSVNSKRYGWSALANGDTGTVLTPELFADYREISVQVLGTFGTGGSVSLQGSNDGGTTWANLLDPAGNALTFTAAGIKTLGVVAERIRPSVTAGDGTTELDVMLFMRGPFR